MATAIIKTSARAGLACLLIYATNAVAASSCSFGTTEPTVKLEAPWNNVISWQLGYPTTPPSPKFIALTTIFADPYTKLVNVKPSGGVYIEDSMHTVEVGSCFPHDFPVDGVTIDANRTCQLYFNINPQLIRKPGYYEGTIAVTYNLEPVKPEAAAFNTKGCSGTGQATTIVKVSIQPPNDQLVLSKGSNVSPISAKVGESEIGILGVELGKGSSWWVQQPSLSDVIFRSHVSIEPSSENNAANPGDFTLDPDSLQAAGIGVSPQFMTWKWGKSIKIIFKPTQPYGYPYPNRYINVVLTSKVCLDASHIDDCLPEKKHVLPIMAKTEPADVTPPKAVERLKASRAQELKKIPAPEAKAKVCWRYSCRNEPRRSRVTCLPRGQFPPGYGVRGACTWQRI